MASPNSSYTDILASTIENRSGVVADNVRKSNAVLFELEKKGRVKTFSGGTKIIQELTYAENGNGAWYSGYDLLSTAAAEVITAPEFNIKQYACPVVISGLEMLQNSGKEAILDLMETRLGVAESTMANAIAAGLYADGTGSGGKEITGLELVAPADPTTGTYGGINRATAGNEFWRSQLKDLTLTAANASGTMLDLWILCSRGNEVPNLIMAGSTAYGFYVKGLQALQMFTDPDLAAAGFTNVKFMSAPVVLDGGIGGFADAEDMYFLNTKYLHYRPHASRNMVPLSPNKRYAINQDAEVQILAWAGNLTCSGAKFQGRLKGD